MIIPYQSLSDDAVDNLIREYCLRDWGVNDVEAPLESRFEAVRKALRDGDLVILYSEHYETASLVSKSELDMAETDAQEPWS